MIIRNIIFDLGNVLIYFDYEYFFDKLIKLEKHLSKSALKKFISEKKLGSRLFTSNITNREYFRILKKKFCLKTGFNDFIYIYSDIFWENKEMKKLIEDLYRGGRYNLFLFSNTDPAHFSFITRNFPFINLIDKKVLSFKIKMMKPQKKAFRYILEKYKLKADETLYIDDLRENTLAAKNAGINSIQYTKHKPFVKKLKNTLLNK
jgi:putative hydrolase of the HAD superfamily